MHVCVRLALDLTHDCTDLRREVASRFLAECRDLEKERSSKVIAGEVGGAAALLKGCGSHGNSLVWLFLFFLLAVESSMPGIDTLGTSSTSGPQDHG